MKKEPSKRTVGKSGKLPTGEVSHVGHRAKVRREFIQSYGASLPEHVLLEILLNVYYTRADANIIARRFLEGRKLPDLLEEFASCDLSTTDAPLSAFLAISSQIVLNAKTFSGEECPLLEKALHAPKKLAKFLMPYLISADDRVFFLCFDEAENLTHVYDIRYGESNLPLMLRYCHLPDVKQVILAFDCKDKTPEDLSASVNYYLNKTVSFPYSWKTYGYMLLSGVEGSLGETFAYFRLDSELV